jgi:hypothetical protein
METKTYKITDAKADRIAGFKVQDGQTHIDLTDDQAKYALLAGDISLDAGKAKPKK